MPTNVYSSHSSPIPITLVENNSFSMSVYWVNSAGAPVTLVGKELTWSIDFGEAGNAVITPTSSNPSGGKIDLVLSSFEVDQIGLHAETHNGTHKLMARDSVTGIFYRLIVGPATFQGDIGTDDEDDDDDGDTPTSRLPVLTIKDFGAKGDGVTNDTAAFNAAIAFANDKGGSDRANIIGTAITIPAGRYRITSALDPITVSSVEFVGESKASSVLLLESTGFVFTFGDSTMARAVVGGGVSNVKLEYINAPTGTACVFNIDYAFSLTFDNLHTHRIGRLVQLGTSSSRIAAGIRFSNIQGSVYNGGFPTFDVRFGAGLFVSDVQLFVSGVLAPVHPASMTTVAGATVFECWRGFWDVIQVTNCLFERFDIGLAISPSSGNVYQNIYISSTIFDYIKRWCIYAEAVNGSSVVEIRIDPSCWFVSWETAAFYFTGVGTNDLHHISGIVAIAGNEAVFYNLPNAGDNVFNAMNFSNVDRLNASSGAMNFVAGSKGFSVLGCTGNRAGLGQANYGIYVGTGCDDYVINGCRLNGAVGDILIEP